MNLHEYLRSDGNFWEVDAKDFVIWELKMRLTFSPKYLLAARRQCGLKQDFIDSLLSFRVEILTQKIGDYGRFHLKSTEIYFFLDIK